VIQLYHSYQQKKELIYTNIIPFFSWNGKIWAFVLISTVSKCSLSACIFTKLCLQDSSHIVLISSPVLYNNLMQRTILSWESLSNINWMWKNWRLTKLQHWYHDQQGLWSC
jgi:hypothetical protein